MRLFIPGALAFLSACAATAVDTAIEPEGAHANDCQDGADNDRDGLFDCDDPGCAAAPDCLVATAPTTEPGGSATPPTSTASPTATDTGPTTSPGTTTGTPPTTTTIPTTGTTSTTGATTATGSTTMVARAYGDWSGCEATVQIVDYAGTVLYQRWETYGARNTLVNTKTDGASPFTGPEQEWAYTYDASDQLIDTLWDANYDGIFDAHNAYSWHPSGNAATESYDTNNDGLWDTEIDLIEVAGRIETSETRLGGSATVHSQMTWIYDPITGDLTRQEADQGLDGVLDASFDYVWPGPAGGEYRKSSDWTADGILDAHSERSTDSSGATTFLWDDFTADGITDRSLSTTYHLDGRIDTTTGTIFDAALSIPAAGLTGYIDLNITHNYDAAGFTAFIYTLANPGNPVFLTELYDNYTWVCGPPIP